MQSSFFKRSLVCLTLAFFVKADYYVDDQDYASIVYTENPGGAKWGPFREGGKMLTLDLPDGSNMIVSASQCFNYTYTYAACTTTDGCQMQIPFNGSGITIHVLQAGPHGINASLAIDGRSPRYNASAASSESSHYVSDVTLFDVQGMTPGTHTATINILSWNDTPSWMIFDRAVINQTVLLPVTGSSKTSSTAVSTASSPTKTAALSSHSTRINIDAIIGGVVGGLVLLLALVAYFLWWRRRRKPAVLSAELDAEPRIGPFFSEDTLYYKTAATEPYTGVPRPPATERGTIYPPQLSQGDFSDDSWRTTTGGRWV